MLLPYSSGCNVLWSLHCREDDADVQRFGSLADTCTLPLVFIEGDLEGQQRRAEMSRTAQPLHCHCVRTSAMVLVTECAKCILLRTVVKMAAQLGSVQRDTATIPTARQTLHKTAALKSFECLPVTVANKYA